MNVSYPQKNKKGIKGLLIFAAVTVLAVSVLCGVLFYLLFYRKSQGRTVTYPELVGSLESQLPSLSEYDVKKIYVHSDIYPRSVVISQSPEGLSRRKTLKARPELEIRISAGRESAEMPELSGRSLYEARVELGKMGCRIKTVKIYGEEHDRVLKSYPAAGKSISSGQSVVLYVGAQARESTLRVPRLAGLELDTAVELVEGLGLEYEICEAYDSQKERGEVISQYPPAESILPSGVRVKIYINSD